MPQVTRSPLKLPFSFGWLGWVGLFANKVVPSIYIADCGSAPLHIDAIFVCY